MRLQVLETLRLIAPAAIIASVVGTTINLLTPSVVGYDNSPGNQFAVGDSIELVDVTTGAVQDRIVQSVTGTTVVVTVAPTITTAGNYIRYSNSSANAGSSAVNLYGYSFDDYIYQQPATLGIVTRWR